MLKRCVDVTVALAGLVVALPILLLAALAIRLTAPGPVLYRARRVGRDGRLFTMYKLRTMRLDRGPRDSRITGVNDPRVFPVGRLLRHAKIDELPQLYNVLRGDMSIVGPRPEEPGIVAVWYTVEHWDTLAARPGLTSPGSLFQYTRGDALLAGDDPETRYLTRLLPIKLALDLVYVRRASLGYDIALIARTALAIAGMLIGRRLAEPPELRLASPFVVPLREPARAPALAAVSAWLLAVGLVGCTAPDDPAGDGSWRNDDTAPVLVGAGDIASCAGSADEATARLLHGMPGTVFTTGDNVYPVGTPDLYEACYGPGWGQLLDRTRPSPGNHDYDAGNGAGYFGYFGQIAAPPLGYYSYDLGAWHVISLNSEIAPAANAPQLDWLAQDLAATGARCIVAYWHRPRFTSGGSHPPDTTVSELWRLLYGAGAEIVLNGHIHNYERFARQNPAGDADPTHGIRQFVVGTGGAEVHGFADPVPNSEVRIRDVPGVLALRLRSDGYDWRFQDTTGAVLDAGTDACHEAPTARAQ